jgi:hypothetical protein
MLIPSASDLQCKGSGQNPPGHVGGRAENSKGEAKYYLVYNEGDKLALGLSFPGKVYKNDTHIGFSIYSPE